jgi:hypothetical protein
MHRQDVPVGQHVVEVGEDGLLDLARILRSGDQHQLLREVHHDRAFGVGAVALRNGVEIGRVQDRQLGNEGREILLRRAQEHVTREQAVPRAFGNDAHRHPVLRICADEQVLHVDVAALVVGQDLTVQVVELFRRRGAIDRPPPDVVAARRLLDQELVLGRAAGVLAGLDDQRAAGGQMTEAPG